MRKVLEKNDWNIDLGIRLLESYQKVQTITEEEMMQLYYRFDYPEKFWKIVNYYYNSGKSFISCRNMEKLDKLLKNQEVQLKFMNRLKNML